MNTQAGPIFYGRQVESANAEQCAYRMISTRSFKAIVIACAPPVASDKSVSELHAPAGVTLSDMTELKTMRQFC